MKKLHLSSLAVAVALTLAACGGSSSSDPEPPPPPPPPPEPSTLAFGGTAIKGTLINALVEVFAADDIEQTTVLASGQTDANGDYSIEVTDASGDPIVGAFVVRITADDDTTMICDALVCEGGVQGEAVPVANLELSTITYSDESGTVDADINVLTTLATETIISAATVEGTEIDLSTITVEELTEVQGDASEIIGAVLGVDLSETNLFDVEIVDASTSADVSTDDATAATLTVINASFSSLDVGDGETLGDVIVDYVAAVTEVTTILIENADADVGLEAAEALVIIQETQAEIAEEVIDITTVIEQDTGVDVPVAEVPTTVDPDDIADTVGDVTGTGGTGGTDG